MSLADLTRAAEPATAESRDLVEKLARMIEDLPVTGRPHIMVALSAVPFFKAGMAFLDTQPPRGPREGWEAFQARHGAWLREYIDTTWPMVWHWRVRLGRRKGHRCRVVVRGAMNSVLVEFADGYRVVTSRYGVRRAHGPRKGSHP